MIIPLHFILCVVAVATTWRQARSVSLALAVIAAATLGAHLFPSSLLWQFAGPLTVVWLARMLWNLDPLEEALPGLALALAILILRRTDQVAIGIYIAMTHLGALLAGLLGLRRRRGPVSREEYLAGALLASCAGGAWGALCWGFWGSTDVSAISDIGFLAVVVLVSRRWQRSSSSA